MWIHLSSGLTELLHKFYIYNLSMPCYTNIYLSLKCVWYFHDRSVLLGRAIYLKHTVYYIDVCLVYLVYPCLCISIDKYLFCFLTLEFFFTSENVVIPILLVFLENRSVSVLGVQLPMRWPALPQTCLYTHHRPPNSNNPRWICFSSW